MLIPDSLGKDQGTKSRGIVKLCSNCHASVELVRNNDLPNVTSNYNESFHGLAVRGGSSRAASCESCHGNHNIRPSSDTLSSIHKKNLGKTCGKCHPGADNIFFNTKIHVLESKVGKSNAVLDYKVLHYFNYWYYRRYDSSQYFGLQKKVKRKKGGDNNINMKY